MKMKDHIVLESYPIVHPHAILAYLFNSVKLEIHPQEIHNYWKDANRFQKPWRTASSTGTHVPLALYGDAARTVVQYKFEKVLGVFLRLVLWRPKSMRYSMFLLFSCETHRMTKTTLNVVLRRLVWSLNFCYEGVHPVTGCRGKELSQREKELAGSPLTTNHDTFVVSEFHGDWEFHRDLWHLNSSWKGKRICFKCTAVPAGDETLLYYNTGESREDNCQWISQEFTKDQFIAQRLKDGRPCISHH